MRCEDCGVDGSRANPVCTGPYERCWLCQRCQHRYLNGLPPVRPMSDEELIRVVLGGPGIRRSSH